MERERSVSRQHPWTMALLWHGTSRYLCSWVSESSSNDLFCSPLKSPTLLTCFMNLGFRNWTWALRLSSTWTLPRSSYGLKLWRGVCTQKPSTRGWEDLKITALLIITKWEFEDTEWMFSLSILYVSSSLAEPFFLFRSELYDLLAWCSWSLSREPSNITWKKWLQSTLEQESWGKWFVHN